MKLSFWRYRIPAIAVLACVSCNKHLKTEANSLPQGYADSQVVGTWKITALQSDVPYDWDGNGTLETDVYSSWPACDKDNLYTFSGTVSGSLDDKTGTFKLNCSVTRAGTWKILNTQVLSITPDGLVTEAEQFISMTAVEFKTTKPVSLPNGQPAILTKTWTRQ